MLKTCYGWLWRFLLALLVLAALAGAGLFFLPSLLQPMLNQILPLLLRDSVGPNSELHVDHVGWRNINIDHLRLMPDANTQIDISNLQLNYDPKDLLLGQLDSLTIERVLVNLSDQTSKDLPDAASVNTDGLATAQTIELPLLADLMALPLKRIDAPNIIIQHPQVSATLSATLTPELWRVNGDTQLNDLPLPWQIELQLQQSGDLLLMVSESEILLAQLYGHLEQNDSESHLTLDQRTDASALSKRLPALADLPLALSNLHLSADIRSPNTVRIPNDLIVQLKADIQSDALALNENTQMAATQLTVSIDKASAADDWVIDADSAQLNLLMKVADDDWTLTAGPLNISSRCNAALNECQLNSKINTAVKGPASMQISLLPELKWQQATGISGTLPLSIKGTQPENLNAEPPIPRAALQADGRLEFNMSNDGHWQVTSTDGIQPHLILGPYLGWQTQPLSLTLLPNLNVHGFTDERGLPVIDAESLSVEIAAFDVSQGDRVLHFKRNEISCEPDRLSSLMLLDQLLGNCEMKLRLGKSKWDLWPIPDMQINGPIAITYNPTRQRILADLKLSAAKKQFNLRTHIEHDLLQGTGSMQWHLNDAPLDWGKLGLDDMANLTKVQLLGGLLSGQGWIDWQGPNAENPDAEWNITPDTMLRADGFNALYDNSMALEEWNAMLALRRPQGGDYLLDAQVSGGKLDNGIALKNILARSQTRIPADFSYAMVDIYEMHTDILGGRVYTPLIRYDSRKEINAFGIRLDHIQLSELAKLEADSGINASGVLDGMLPIVLTPEGPMVPGGNLFARDPGGIIQYRSSAGEALKSSDQTVGMAMNLLDNFLYNQLESGIQYQPDGSLNIALQFQGKNPDFFGGQATHLNINLDYNLLDLLESLRITNEVVEKVEVKYR